MEHAEQTQSRQHHRRPAAERVSGPSNAPAFADNRPVAFAQRKLAEAIERSPQASAQRALSYGIHNSPTGIAQRERLGGMFGEAAQLQRRPEEEELLQGKLAWVQRQVMEEEELLQGKFATLQRQGPEEEEELQMKQGARAESPAQFELEIAPRENNTGLPDDLKSSIESLSGISSSSPTRSDSANVSCLPLQRAVESGFGVLPVIQLEFDDADKVDEDAVGFLRGPCQGPEGGTWKPEGKNDFGEIDGGISSGVMPHAFTDGGRTGESTWHHCGGGGGKGNENVGSADLVAPVYESKPARPGGQAKAWIAKGTGTVKVKRSFTGVTHGAQGAFTAPPPGTVWMSPRARERVDKHEREHTKKTKEIHQTYIEPLERRIAKYRGFLHAKKAGADEATAIAALQTEIDWNSAVQSFATEDVNENTPMGPVDTTDMQQADFYADFPTSAKFQQQSQCTIYEGVGASKKRKT